MAQSKPCKFDVCMAAKDSWQRHMMVRGSLIDNPDVGCDWLGCRAAKKWTHSVGHLEICDNAILAAQHDFLS